MDRRGVVDTSRARERERRHRRRGWLAAYVVGFRVKVAPSAVTPADTSEGGEVSRRIIRRKCFFRKGEKPDERQRLKHSFSPEEVAERRAREE